MCADVAKSVEGLEGKIEAETCDADLWAPIEVKGKGGEKVGWDSSKCNAQTVQCSWVPTSQVWS